MYEARWTTEAPSGTDTKRHLQVLYCRYSSGETPAVPTGKENGGMPEPPPGWNFDFILEIVELIQCVCVCVSEAMKPLTWIDIHACCPPRSKPCEFGVKSPGWVGISISQRGRHAPLHLDQTPQPN